MVSKSNQPEIKNSYFTLIGFLKCRWHYRLRYGIFDKTQWGYEIFDGVSENCVGR